MHDKDGTGQRQYGTFVPQFGELPAVCHQASAD